MVSSQGLVVGCWRVKGVVEEEEMDKEEEREGRKDSKTKIASWGFWVPACFLTSCPYIPPCLCRETPKPSLHYFTPSLFLFPIPCQVLDSTGRYLFLLNFCINRRWRQGGRRQGKERWLVSLHQAGFTQEQIYFLSPCDSDLKLPHDLYSIYKKGTNLLWFN